jgi:hypothetical protein
MKKADGNMHPGGSVVLYRTEDGKTRLEVQFEDETVWLTQKRMAELFQKDVRTVNEHIQNIFEEHELDPRSVVRNYRITAADGKVYDTQRCDTGKMPVLQTRSKLLEKFQSVIYNKES